MTLKTSTRRSPPFDQTNSKNTLLTLLLTPLQSTVVVSLEKETSILTSVSFTLSSSQYLEEIGHLG